MWEMLRRKQHPSRGYMSTTANVDLFTNVEMTQKSCDKTTFNNKDFGWLS